MVFLALAAARPGGRVSLEELVARASPEELLEAIWEVLGRVRLALECQRKLPSSHPSEVLVSVLSGRA
jgi:hypothetical protein